MTRAIKKVGIVGAGQMGGGIAHVVALAGFDVVLNDVSADRIKSSLATINGNMARQIARGKIGEDDRKRALSRIRIGDSLEELGDADLVIEAATEDEDVKRRIFSSLCPHLKADAMLATNTSSISITRLAASTDRPERFIGMHFMNPVPLMDLVEMIRGIATEEDTFRNARLWVG